ncbi:flagellar basal body rod protein FlgC [bacterium F16]|nr:flagellar basal body rod protein FlgC [bacterium F16]
MIPELAPGMRISATGMDAERMRMEIASHNLANSHTTKDVDGAQYKRRIPVFKSMIDEAMKKEAAGLEGVKVDDVVLDHSPGESKYLPWHPDADSDGYVKMPNISPMIEMLDIMTASRMYEANLSAIKQGKQMYKGTIDLLRG